MTSARRVNMVATIVLLISLAGGVVTLHAIDQMALVSPAQQALYIRSTTVLRRMCLGYTGLLADIYWTRAVQYFGFQHFKGSGDFRLLAPLLQVTTELDPHMLPPYQFGANFLGPKPPNGAGLPGDAMNLLRFGIEHNPDQWRLYYNLGFLYFTEFKDYAKAADAFERGAKLPFACCGTRRTRARKRLRSRKMRSTICGLCRSMKRSRNWKAWSRSIASRWGTSL
ncbi:MAG: hypothetical protein ABSD39_09695 [Terriglobales bacterium]